MPRLIHLNGPPGAGKSTVARVVADESPMMLVIEIDELRTRLGGWRFDPETKLRARGLAIAMIENHLAAGHDVIVPQFIGRSEFIERLAAVAETSGAGFHEIVLIVDEEVAVERFRARRAALALAGDDHPERDVADDDVSTIVADAIDRLVRLRISGIELVRLSITATPFGTAATVRRALG